MKSLTSPKIKALVMKVCEMCFDINTQTNYCAFVDMSGHVEWITVSIRQNKKDYENVIHLLGNMERITANYSMCEETPGDVALEEFEADLIYRLELIISKLKKFLPVPTREKAIEWWNGKSESNKKELCKAWLPSFVNYQYVTGLQIEIIYENATGEKEASNA